MLKKLLAPFTSRPRRYRACVLLYHRVAALESDIWNIAVAPATFEQHARLLRASYHVVSAADLVESLARGTVRPNTVAITFDDGYADNFLTAKPILDYYQLPATFFVASHYTDRAEEFWWDELERLILFSPLLPALFSAPVATQQVEVALGEETYLTNERREQQCRWNACTEPPPTRRGALFLRLWELLRPLIYPEQQEELRTLRHWAGAAPSQRPDYCAMSRAQVQRLGQSPLHQLGLHTVSHPALAFHSGERQRQEVLGNQAFLKSITGRKAELLAYPYGNYNQETLTLVEQAGLRAAFTTEEKAVTSTCNPYRLGRFVVPDCSAPTLERSLQQWLHNF